MDKQLKREIDEVAAWARVNGYPLASRWMLQRQKAERKAERKPRTQMVSLDPKNRKRNRSYAFPIAPERLADSPTDGESYGTKGE